MLAGAFPVPNLQSRGKKGEKIKKKTNHCFVYYQSWIFT